MAVSHVLPDRGMIPHSNVVSLRQHTMSVIEELLQLLDFLSLTKHVVRRDRTSTPKHATAPHFEMRTGILETTDSSQSDDDTPSRVPIDYERVNETQKAKRPALTRPYSEVLDVLIRYIGTPNSKYVKDFMLYMPATV